MRLHIVVSLVLALCTSASALTEAEIQKYIDEAIKAGGGEVVIPPGVHLLTRRLMLKDAKKIRLVGLDAERCILKLPPVAYAETSEAMPAGADRLITTKLQNITPGMRLRIEYSGEMEPFTQKPRPYLIAHVLSIVGGTIQLKEPLKFPVPAQTVVRDEDAPNAIEVRGVSENITIEKLCIDGGRVASDPPVRGHTQLCGLFIAGPYTYEKGPTGPRVVGVKALRCIFQNCHGRGVAFYSAEGGGVEDCTFMDISDEAVDLDHFAEKILVQHNHITRSLRGVELNDANDCLVNANELRQCDTGIHLWRWCKLPGWNEGNAITNNLIEQTAGNAIQLGEDTARNKVEQNDITDSGKNGIVVQGTDQVVKDNRIHGSKLKDLVSDP